jgi:hypothetical protein
MGLNATVVVNLDRLNQIEEDPAFGKELSRAIQDQTPFEGVTDGPHGTRVVFVHHSSCLAPILVGGNTGMAIPAFTRINPNETDEETKIQVLKKMARVLGYRVSKVRR